MTTIRQIKVGLLDVVRGGIAALLLVVLLVKWPLDIINYRLSLFDVVVLKVRLDASDSDKSCQNPPKDSPDRKPYTGTWYRYN